MSYNIFLYKYKKQQNKNAVDLRDINKWNRLKKILNKFQYESTWLLKCLIYFICIFVYIQLQKCDLLLELN